MRKIIFIVLVQFSFFNFQFSLAQTADFYRYQIRFTDKNHNQFSISHPENFLSPKAIERRVKQNILIDSLDLPVSKMYIDSVKNTGVMVLYSSKWLNSVTIFTTDSLALIHINTFPFIKSMKAVAKNLSAQNQEEQKFIGALKTECSTDDYYGFAFDQINQVRGQSLHQTGFKGNGMLIAYLDAGFLNADVNPAFDSIRNRNGIIATRDFVAGGSEVYEDNPHGAFCFSIAAANVPGYYVGTAPEADYVLIRTENAPDEFPIEEINWAAGAEFADSIGADVISSSLGYSVFDTVFSATDTFTFNHTFLDMDGITNPSSIAANIASSRGIIVCNSAGNSGADANWRFITAPADAENILTIGAIDSSGNYAAFSGHGPTFDGRIKPDVAGRGALTWYINASYGTANEGNGTSFSCPLIAGLTACLWQAHREKSNIEIMDAIRKSASKYFSPDNNIGYGTPNFAYADLLLSGFSEQSLLSPDSVVVYPTIFSGEIKINLKTKVDEEISTEIYDLSGRLVNQECMYAFSGFNELSFQSANLTAGVYVLKIIAGNKIHFEKLVKI